MPFEKDWKKLEQFIDAALAGGGAWPSSPGGALVKSLRTSVGEVAKGLDWDEKGVTARMQEARTRTGLAGSLKNLVGKKEAVAQLENFKNSVKRLKALSAEASGLASTVDKAADPVRYRALKALAAGLEKLAAQAAYLRADMERDLEAWGKNIDQALQTGKMEDLALKNLKKAVTGAIAGIQAIKADPTVRTWDSQFDGGNIGRNVFMALKLVGEAQAKDPGAAQALSVTVHFKAELDPYKAKAAGRAVMPNGATTAAVLVQLKDFSRRVKDVQDHYKPFW